ncbi:UbiA family prenyltransferase [Verrucomicrobium sp. BvORR034]|uniref:UbiA family prenyltransferase n=1 Tax=Verrucomicrobium sp. BvORR034 TaxID=1396418 RepID=UPI0006797FEE|nr:UbiA family prenyltransferase [Verrucomicrobium sp. BvORR034]
MKLLRPWLELARISNLPTAWTNVLAGWLLAGGGRDYGVVGWILLGGSLLYTGGMILNDAADVKFDREHRKERPIPSGRVSAGTVWLVGLGMMVAGAGAFIFGAGACPWLVGGLVLAILAYDFYHKPWAGSVFVMGSCRTLLVLSAASAVTGGLDPRADLPVILRAIALGGYIVGVTLIARHESRPAQAGGWQRVVGYFGLALPVLVTAGILATQQPLASYFQKPQWTHAVALAAMLPVIFCVRKALRLMRTPPPSNIGRAVGLLLAGIVFVDGLAVSLTAPAFTLVFVLCFPLLLLWQRKIAAT